MAVGLVEMHGQVTRAQDFTTIKHNEDTRPAVEQAHFGQQLTKHVEKQVNRVNQGDKPEYHERKFDAKDKGSNEYNGDGGKKRKKKPGVNPDGKVLMKKAEHIDFSV